MKKSRKTDLPATPRTGRKSRKKDFAVIIGITGLILAFLTFLFGDGILRNIFERNQPSATEPTDVFLSTASIVSKDYVDHDPLQNIIPMRYIPEGDFLMGEDAQVGMQECQKYRNDCSLDFFTDEELAHTVYLDAFYIDKFEVTNYLYTACVSAGVCDAPSKNLSDPQFDNYPVVHVNWFMANDYCKWRGARLPSEAQWEKAARGAGTTNRIFPWGNNIDCNRANYWDWTNGRHCVGGPTKVGSYPDGISPYGVYDMAGNVWEWTSSLYRPYPYNSNDGREDLSASGERVLRGGSWYYYFYGLPRNTERLAYDPYFSGGDIGLRCVSLVP